VNDQLELFAETSATATTRLNREQAGLRHGAPAGPAKLLAELVKRGLGEDDLRAAAMLCIALEDVAVEEGES
jgi:hypothetical protein